LCAYNIDVFSRSEDIAINLKQGMEKWPRNSPALFPPTKVKQSCINPNIAVTAAKDALHAYLLVAMHGHPSLPSASFFGP
jgi:hypothetical protein